MANSPMPKWPKWKSDNSQVRKARTVQPKVLQDEATGYDNPKPSRLLQDDPDAHSLADVLNGRHDRDEDTDQPYSFTSISIFRRR